MLERDTFDAVSGRCNERHRGHARQLVMHLDMTTYVQILPNGLVLILGNDPSVDLTAARADDELARPPMRRQPPPSDDDQLLEPIASTKIDLVRAADQA